MALDNDPCSKLTTSHTYIVPIYPSLTAAVLFLAAPHISLAAQTLPRLSPAAITPGVDTFIVTYGSQTIGRSIQVTAADSTDGRRLWRQGYRFESPDGDVSTDTLWVDATTLLPVTEVRTNSAGRFVVTYGTKSITTKHTPPGGVPATAQLPITTPVFASATLEMLARALPLAAGLDVPVTVYYGAPSQTGVVETRFRVPRADSLRAKDGTVRQVWIVTVGTAGGETTFWIDKTDRRLLQFDTSEGDALIQFRRP